ncbi:hypothetical protein STEG23_024278, partial [Scotinomys teguina]
KELKSRKKNLELNRWQQRNLHPHQTEVTVKERCLLGVRKPRHAVDTQGNRPCAK